MRLKSIAMRMSAWPKQKKILAACFPLLAVAIFSSSRDHSLQGTIELSLPESQVIDSILAENQAAQDIPDYEYKITAGDNLSLIFNKLGFAYQDLMKVMDTDLNYLMLDTIKSGDTLRFWKNAQGELQKMELVFNIADRAVYTRLDDGAFEYHAVKLAGTWKPMPVVGEIHGSFSVSAHKLGLSAAETSQIATLLKDKLNFQRDLRAGDRFEVVKSRQFVGDEATGNSEVEAVRIFNRGREIAMYLHNDGQYYDQDGNSLQRAFQRHPFAGNYRISSGFDPQRRHPVTGRIAPHNGTDWAAPTGTPVLATGDGVVTLTLNHPYAGKYVVLQHGSTYTTRYLHLSQILVKKGQRVSRGQRIALSGATGRVTGPHIHYEFIVRGRPVNPVTANIPMANSVPKAEMAQFKAKRDKLNAMLEEQTRLVNSTATQPSDTAING